MSRLPYTVAVAPGDGLIVRAGDVVMYIADASLSAGPLIAAVKSVGDGEQPAGAVVARSAISLSASPRPLRLLAQ